MPTWVLNHSVCSPPGANRLPSVPACYFHDSHLISLEHAEMVTDEMIEGKDLAWRRTGHDDDAGQFVPWGGIVAASASASFCFSN